MNSNAIHTLVVTGAGFSKAAGLPLESEIIPAGARLSKHLDKEVLREFNRQVRQFFGKSAGSEMSIEDLLTRMLLEERYERKMYIPEVIQLEAAVLNLFRLSLKGSTPSAIPDVYAHFLKKLRSPFAFATLNQDLLLEHILDVEHIKWNYLLKRYLLGSPLSSSYSKARKRLRLGPNERLVPYLKLHGSFNWHKCPNCGQAYISKPEYFRVSAHTQSRSDPEAICCPKCEDRSLGASILRPIILGPALIKEYTIFPIHIVWGMFDAFISQVKRLIIVGTSLREQDVRLIHSLSYLSEKSPALRELILIDPNRMLVSRLHRITEKDVIYFRDLSHFINEY